MANADGSVIIKTRVEVDKAEKDLAKLKKSIEKTEEEIEELTKEKEKAKERGVFSAAELEREKQKLVELKRQLEEIRAVSKDKSFSEAYRAEARANIPEQQAAVSDQAARVRALQVEHNRVNTAVNQYDQKLGSANRKLEKQTNEAGALARRLAAADTSAIKMGEAMKRAEKNTRKFGLRLKEVLRSALIFTLISQTLAKFRDWLGGVIKTNSEATAAIAKLKGALLTMAQPLVDVLIPAFTKLLNIMAAVVEIFARFISAAAGKTYEETKQTAEELYNEQQAIEGIGSAAKKTAKQLASFDEINKLTGESAGGISNVIFPDFTGTSLDILPEWLKDLVFDVEATIRGIRFSYDEGKLAENKDAWVVCLSGILGAVLGTMFFGLNGTIIGLLLGVAAGLISCEFLNDLENPGKAKSSFAVALGAIVGAVIGAKLGGLTGGVIGLLLGAAITLISLEFAKGENGNWDSDDTLVVVLSSILGAILGATLGGFTGSVIGLLLGLTISFSAIKFKEGNYDKDRAVAYLRIAIFTILGTCLGAWFGGPVGAGVGALIGLTIGFSTVAFDEKLNEAVRNTAKKGLLVALTTMIGALVGAVLGAGVFGGIIGGVIGLALGLAITLSIDSIDDSAVRRGFSSGQFGGGRKVGGSFSISAPGLATGAVVPPNREFMAILGDNKTETEVVSPLSTMKQAMLEAMRESGGGRGDVNLVLTGELAALARVLRPYIEDEGRRVGTNLVIK